MSNPDNNERSAFFNECLAVVRTIMGNRPSASYDHHVTTWRNHLLNIEHDRVINEALLLSGVRLYDPGDPEDDDDVPWFERDPSDEGYVEFDPGLVRNFRYIVSVFMKGLPPHLFGTNDLNQVEMMKDSSEALGHYVEIEDRDND